MNACIALQDFATPMNRNQLNDTGMLNTVSSYMATNNSIWGGVPAMTVTVAEVKANIARIDDKMGKQQTPTTGATDEKTQVRGDFEDQILLIADQLSSLAAKNADQNLGAQVDLNISTLDKLSDDELEETGKRISALATARAELVLHFDAPYIEVLPLTFY